MQPQSKQNPNGSDQLRKTSLRHWGRKGNAQLFPYLLYFQNILTPIKNPQGALTAIRYKYSLKEHSKLKIEESNQKHVKSLTKEKCLRHIPPFLQVFLPCLHHVYPEGVKELVSRGDMTEKKMASTTTKVTVRAGSTVRQKHFFLSLLTVLLCCHNVCLGPPNMACCLRCSRRCYPIPKFYFQSSQLLYMQWGEDAILFFASGSKTPWFGNDNI